MINLYLVNTGTVNYDMYISVNNLYYKKICSVDRRPQPVR